MSDIPWGTLCRWQTLGGQGEPRTLADAVNEFTGMTADQKGAVRCLIADAPVPVPRRRRKGYRALFPDDLNRLAERLGS